MIQYTPRCPLCSSEETSENENYFALNRCAYVCNHCGHFFNH